MFSKEKWRAIWNDVNAFDQRITDTNPFSEVNYTRKKYTSFREFYEPRPEHVVVWVDDD